MNKQIAIVIAAAAKLDAAAAALYDSRVWARASALDDYKNEMRSLLDDNEETVEFAKNEGKAVEEMGALYARLAAKVKALEAKKPAALTSAEHEQMDRLLSAHDEARAEWADVSYSIRCAARKNADLRRSILLEKQFPAELAHEIRREAERSPSSAMFYYAA